jgi:L-lactate dehydrogenase complex protein LldE
MVKVLRTHGVRLNFPREQTCCGQPAFNNGYWGEARKLARHFLDTFDNNDFIITPSGSCAAMVKKHYTALFPDDRAMQERCRELGKLVYEFSEFLVKVLKLENVNSTYRGRVAYHHSCHLLRDLGIEDEPLRLIKSIKGLEYVELEKADQCCGFGGTFSVRYPEISRAMVDDKVSRIKKAEVDALVVNDTGCMINIAGRLSRLGERVKVLHLAELLAGAEDGASQGE